jgi:hypothetical protein
MPGQSLKYKMQKPAENTVSEMDSCSYDQKINSGIALKYLLRECIHVNNHGEDCTFETMVKRFGIRDRSVQSIAEMIHDADLADEKFQRPECLGLDRIFKGWARLESSDREILSKGFECFDALHATLRAEDAPTDP